jgi:YesN/AraC family two-component response regulator
MNTCLIIDDERLACYRLKELLGKCDIDTSLISCDTNPLRVLEEKLYLNKDILFMDIDMPELDGLELNCMFKKKD